MSTSKYTPVADEDRGGTSNGSDETSTHLTPDSDSDDDLALRDLETEGGYELRPLNKDGQSLAGAQNGDGDSEDDSEDDDDNGIRGSRNRRRKRRPSAASFELYTPDEERRVLRKLDTRLVLFVALLYLLSFLDRSNIGNAKVAGLDRDLRLTSNQFEWLLTSFYIAYIAFEWMTLCYRIFPPHKYIASCVCAWGVLASLQSLVSSFPALVILRFLLGIGEAAFVGIPFYLSFFFRREELALRVGLFIAAAPLATTFASTLAWGIASLGDRTGIASWRLLFLVEGFPAVLVSVWTWYWVPDSPGTARWLTPRERKIATLRMRKEISAAVRATGITNRTTTTTLPRHKTPLNWPAIRATLTDPKAYLTALIFFACNVAFSSMPVFLPTIIHAMGYTATSSQALAAPPFLCAFLAIPLTAYTSDRLLTRSGPLLFHATLALAGYTLAAMAGMAEARPLLRYLCVYPICIGFFSAVTLTITWTLNLQSTDEGKGAGMAVLNVIGQMGPLVGTRLYPERDAPFYVPGMTACAGAMMGVLVLGYVLRVVLRQENARRRGRGRGEWEFIT